MAKTKLDSSVLHTTYFVSAEEAYDINTNMTRGGVAAEQGKFWAAIAALPAGRRGDMVLPNEAERKEKEGKNKNRSVQPQYLNYR